MSSITESVDVAVPIRTAYDQWTQFESFPEFMEGVESVEIGRAARRDHDALPADAERRSHPGRVGHSCTSVS
ncbi:MAG TPA: SRPBCC family protein [Actinopolymorphaceae bacterium]